MFCLFDQNPKPHSNEKRLIIQFKIIIFIMVRNLKGMDMGPLCLFHEVTKNPSILWVLDFFFQKFNGGVSPARASYCVLGGHLQVSLASLHTSWLNQYYTNHQLLGHIYW